MIRNVHDIQKDSMHLGDSVMNHKTTGTAITNFSIKILVSLLLFIFDKLHQTLALGES